MSRQVHRYRRQASSHIGASCSCVRAGVIVLFETQTFGHSAEVGAVEAQFAGGAGPVVLVALQAGADDLALVVLGGLAQVAGDNRGHIGR